MINFTKYRIVLWDFDGVILNSMSIRRMGFEQVLADFPVNQVSELILYHERNGGLSRYVKFRYFFEEIRKERVTEDKVNAYAQRFSMIMRDLLCDPSLLIEDSVNFIKKHSAFKSMHIVSGSDENELEYLCNKLGILHYFKSVHGSPKSKTDIVGDLIQGYNYQVSEVVLVGDSFNDRDSAHAHGIDFIGYNNLLLKQHVDKYIISFATDVI